MGRVEGTLLEALNLRVDDGGVAALDGLSMATHGRRVLILAGARALFEAASGMRPIAHGTLRIDGVEPLRALKRAHIAGAPLDAPLPDKWTPRDYVTWSARLAGRSQTDANTLAHDALRSMRMGALGEAKLAKAAPQVKRATAIAAAIATGARVVLLDDPLAALPEEAARSLADVAVQALDGRAWIVFAPRISLTSPFALHAEEAVVLAGGSVAAQGAPSAIAARDRSYAIDVHGDADAFARKLEERGAKVDSNGPAALPRRLVVDLAPSQGTGDLLACATDAGAVIVELRPLARAFA